MEPNLDIEIIEKYLDGSLESDALKAFEQRLQNDPVLANRVELLKRVEASIEDEKAVEVQKITMDFGDEFFKTKTAEAVPTKLRRLPFYRRPLAIAASFLLIITLGFLVWWQMNNDPQSYQELYATYYVPFQAGDANSRGGVPDENLYNQAIQQYNVNDYTGAITTFEQHLISKPSDMQAVYVLAHAYLNESPPSFDRAADYFQQIIKDGKSVQVTKSQWYLALIYLKQKNVIQAKKVLNSLVKSQDNKMAAKAKDLLEQL